MGRISTVYDLLILLNTPSHSKVTIEKGQKGCWPPQVVRFRYGWEQSSIRCTFSQSALLIWPIIIPFAPGCVCCSTHKRETPVPTFFPVAAFETPTWKSYNGLPLKCGWYGTKTIIFFNVLLANSSQPYFKFRTFPPSSTFVMKRTTGSVVTVNKPSLGIKFAPQPRVITNVSFLVCGVGIQPPTTPGGMMAKSGLFPPGRRTVGKRLSFQVMGAPRTPFPCCLMTCLGLLVVLNAVRFQFVDSINFACDVHDWAKIHYQKLNEIWISWNRIT